MQSPESLIQTAPQLDLVIKEKKFKIFLAVVNNISYLGNTKMLLLRSAKRITKLALSKVHLDCVWTCGSCWTANFQVLIFLVKIRYY